MAGFKSDAGAKSDIAYHVEQSPTLLAGNNDASVVIVPAGFSQSAYDKFIDADKSATLKAQGGSYGGGSETLIVEGLDGYNATLTGEKSSTLGVNCGMSTGRNGVLSVDCRNGTENEKAGALQADSYKNLNCNNTIRSKGIVRRLTPLECERLQGFPDGWTQIGEAVDCLRYEADGEEYIEVVYEYTNSAGKRLKTTDSARYKALGNSIALPSWAYVLQKLSLCCGAEHTMASLFDGIGGFPLIWEGLHGQGSCLWASEIEEFPIAVTKERFPEQE